MSFRTIVVMIIEVPVFLWGRIPSAPDGGQRVRVPDEPHGGRDLSRRGPVHAPHPVPLPKERGSPSQLKTAGCSAWRRREAKPLRADPPSLETRGIPRFPSENGAPICPASPVVSVRFGLFLVPLDPLPGHSGELPSSRNFNGIDSLTYCGHAQILRPNCCRDPVVLYRPRVPPPVGLWCHPQARAVGPASRGAFTTPRCPPGLPVALGASTTPSFGLRDPGAFTTPPPRTHASQIRRHQLLLIVPAARVRVVLGRRLLFFGFRMNSERTLRIASPDAFLPLSDMYLGSELSSKK